MIQPSILSSAPPTHPSASDSVVFLQHCDIARLCTLYKFTYLLTYLLTYLSNKAHAHRDKQ